MGERENKYLPSDSPIPPSSALRPTFVEVDLEVLISNFSLLRDHAGNQIEILPVIKADAYGHGVLPVAGELIQAGARKLAVATLEEGIELREAGFQNPIIILGGILNRQVSQVVAYQLTPFVFDLRTVEALSHQAVQKERSVKVHVEVDTGMGRLGIPYTEALGFLETLFTYPGIELEGLATHFATADEPDNEFVKIQLYRFYKVYHQVKKAGYQIPFYHISNSAGLLNAIVINEIKQFEGATGGLTPIFNMVRPGIALYGVPPSRDLTSVLPLKPVMKFKTEVVFLKRVSPGTPISYGRSFVTSQESLIATLPVGYGDGYSRFLSNKGEVLIQGKRCPIIGRVCMDFCMVDVSKIPQVKVGDEVVLLGNQGTDRITAAEIADWIGTIPYEVVCSIGRRVPRVYLKEGKVVCIRGHDQVYRYF
jgi:alanine racemase